MLVNVLLAGCVVIRQPAQRAETTAGSFESPSQAPGRARDIEIVLLAAGPHDQGIPPTKLSGREQVDCQSACFVDGEFVDLAPVGMPVAILAVVENTIGEQLTD